MPYTLIKLLTGGTFSTGVGQDWRLQFGSAPIAASLPTVAGEVLYPGAGTVFGVYAAYAFDSANPFDRAVCLPEATAGAPIQVYVNGVLVSEASSAGSLVCSVVRGTNLFEYVRAQAPLVIVPEGPMIDPSGRTGRWVSLYPSGSDPFEAGGIRSPISGAGI